MAGRPRKLGDEEYEQVEKLAGLGLTIEMISDFLGINPSTAHRDKQFCKIYKKSFAELGSKTRIELLKKAENDTTANIYLDKIINKTMEKYQEEKLKIDREKLEIEKQKLNKDNDSEEKAISILEKIEAGLNGNE